MSLQQNPVSGAKVGLMVGGLVILVLGVFVGVGVLVRNADSAGPPAVAASTAPVETASTAPTVEPSRNPRGEPDVDRGTPLDHGVFVEIAKGWTPLKSDYYGIRVESFERGAAAAFYLSTHPLPSAPLLRPDAEAFAELQELHGVKVGPVETLPPPNLNIVEAGRVSFTGRRTIDGVTYSLAGECVRLRAAPTVNDLSASICFAAYVQDLDTVRAEVQQMTASLARSI